VVLPLSLFYLENHVCFISWCAASMCGMTSSDEDHGKSRRPSAEDRGWPHKSGTQWPDDREIG
jgi:hypothetical protein